MIHELIVTSAPRGLQAGRSGFTTVCRTRGIHPDLAARLEAASGYRHVHPQGDPRNPVIFSYTLKSSTVGEVWVMSRVGDAGTDYTGRSNKIAHHIALQSSDLAALSASNPAAVIAALTASQGLLSKWAGEPHEKAAPPFVPAPATPPALCERWAALAGDAGWAGHLIERGLAKEATWVIAPPGTDLLSLFSEALALAAPPQRWQMSFTTYSLRGDEGRWLGAVAGTPEADAALAQSRIPVIDLTRRSMAPAGGLYAAAARGQASLPWHRASPPPSTGRPITPAPAQRPGATAPLAPSPSHEPVPLQPATPPLLLRAAMSGSRPPELTEWEDRPVGKPRTYRWLLVGGACLFALVPSALLVMYGLLSPEISQWRGIRPVATNNGTAKSDPQPRAEAVAQPDAAGDIAATKHGDGKQRDAVREVSKREEPGKRDAEPSDPSMGKIAIPAAEKKGPSVFALLKESIEKQRHLPKQGLNTRPTDGRFVITAWEKRGEPSSLEHVTLQLPPADQRTGNECCLKKAVRLEDETDRETTRRWECTDGEETVGTFELDVNKLVFKPAVALASSTLPFLPLRVVDMRSESDPAEVQLLRPLEHACHITRDSTNHPIFTSEPNLTTSDHLLRSVFLAHPQILRWTDCELTAAGPPLSLSPVGQFIFGTTLPLTVHYDSSPEFAFWWRPPAFGPQSSFQESACLTIVPPKIDAGSCYLGLSVTIHCDRTIDHTHKKSNSTQFITLLRKAINNEELTGANWKTILRSVVTNGGLQEKAPSFNDIEKRHAGLFAETSRKKLIDWLDAVKDVCADDKAFAAHFTADIDRDAEKEIKQLGPEPQLRPPQDKKASEDDRKAFEGELIKWRHRRLAISDKAQAEKAKLLRDAKTLTLWAAEHLDAPCGDAKAVTLEHVPLALWRVLQKQYEAYGKGYAYSPAMRGEKDTDLKDLAEVAANATFYLRGSLDLDWNAKAAEGGAGDKWPPVRVVTFTPPPPAGQVGSAAENAPGPTPAGPDKATLEDGGR
jgi:hypothetical protein